MLDLGVSFPEGNSAHSDHLLEIARSRWRFREIPVVPPVKLLFSTNLRKFPGNFRSASFFCSSVTGILFPFEVRLHYDLLVFIGQPGIVQVGLGACRVADG